MPKLACRECHSPNVIGYEVRGVYDGVLFWVCLACGHPFHRFGHDHPMRRKASVELNRFERDGVYQRWVERQAQQEQSR